MRYRLHTDFRTDNGLPGRPSTVFGLASPVLSLLLLMVSGVHLVSAASFSPPKFVVAFQEGSGSKQAAPTPSEDDAVSRARIEKLISQLSSPSYSVRQGAVQQIWRLGKSATPALERAVKAGDPEVAKRASEILTVLSMGIDFDTDPELAKLVLQFNGGEKEVKQRVLIDLLGDQKLALVFELLEQVESDDDQEWLFESVLDFNSEVIKYGRDGRWEDVALMHQHRLTLKYNPISVVQYQLAAGGLKPTIEKLQQQIASAEKDGKKIELKNLLELISVLRMQQRFEEAQNYVAKIEKKEIRNRFSNQILMEKGDWKAIAKKMPGPEENPTVDNGLIEVTDSQRALVYQFVGDQAAYQKVIESLLEQAEEAKSDGDQETSRRILDNVVQIAMVGLDWELAHEHFNFKDVSLTYDLLIETRRVEEAFELIGLGDTLEKRDLWFKRKMRYADSLRKKIARLKAARDDADSTEEKLASVWEMCLGSTGITTTLDGLGLTDEASAHYHTMFANLSDEDDVSQRADIVGRLFWMGRYEEARRLFEEGFSEAEFDNVATKVAAPQKRSHMNFWLEQLKLRYSDQDKRLHVAAGIVNSPFCKFEDFDLRYELAGIPPVQAYINSGYWDYQLAQVYRYHGDTAKYQSHIQLAQQSGYPVEAPAEISKAVATGDWKRVIEFYDSPPKNTTIYAGLLVAEAFGELGDARQSALRTAVAFAIWQEGYSNSSTVYKLKQVDKARLATDFLKLQVCHSDEDDGSEVANEQYRGLLAQSQLQSDPKAAQDNHRLILFDHFASEHHGEGMGLYWAEEVIKFKLGLARSKIAEGDLDEAAELIVQCDRFAPGDPGLGEELIPELDQAGGTEQADRVFDQMSGFFYDVLAKYPESPLHHNNYAWLCACAQRHKDHMLRHAKIAIRQRPDSSSYLDTLATVYFLIGEKEKAIELCQRCIEIYPTKKHYRDQLIRFTE